MEESRLEYWNNFIKKNINQEVYVDDNILYISIVNQGVDELKSFFFFENKIDLLQFLKEVVLVSITLSALYDSKPPSIYLREHTEVLEALEMHTDYFNKRIKDAYVFLYSKLNSILNEGKSEELEKVIIEIEKSFDVYGNVYATLDFAQDTKSYLQALIDEYNKENSLEILSRELKAKGLNIDYINEVIEDMFSYEENIRENLFEKLI